MPSRREDRRSRWIVPAIVALLLLWVLKFNFPHDTIQSTVSLHIIGSSTSADQVHKGANTNDTKTHSEPSLEAKLKSASAYGLMSNNQTAKSNSSVTDKVAIMIEDRPSKNIIPLIIHFHSVLGPDWPIVIYTSSENVGVFAGSAAMKRYLRLGKISVRILPLLTPKSKSDSVTQLLTQPWLWEDLAPADHVLIFQSDSMLCSNSARSVDDFVQFDFVGATIGGHLGSSSKGALSLRKRRTILRVLLEFDFETSKGSRFEDRWFFDRMWEIKSREEAAGIEPSIHMPSIEISRTFAVESVDFPHPLGVHQVHQYLGDRKALNDWCPEYKLCSSEWS